MVKMLIHLNISPPVDYKKDMNHSVCKFDILFDSQLGNLSFLTRKKKGTYFFFLVAYFRNMRRPVTHWYTKDQPIFENTDDMVDCRIDVTRIPGGADTPPCLKISHNTFETMEKANWEFLRLSLPVTCQSDFISEQDKLRRWEDIKLRQHRLAAEVEAQQAQPTHIDHIMKSGFTMNDIKGLHRFGEETGDIDDQMALQMSPSRPGRKTSVGRGSPTFDMMNSMARSTSALDIDAYQIDGDDKGDKKRGRSPFKFFKKSHSKEKHKSKSPPDRNRGRGTCMKFKYF